MNRASHPDDVPSASVTNPAARYTEADPPDEARAGALARSLDRSCVREAAERIRGRVRVTPALKITALGQPLGVELWLKCENLQRIGAFKARGAMHAVGRLPADVRARGICTFSSGNHAQAVALAAREYAVGAHICMPTDAPAVKVAGVRALGATIEFAGTTSEDRRQACMRYAEQSGAVVIQPFDHPDIVAGAGTATLEFREQVRELAGAPLDVLIVPVGGGGVIAGACLAYRDRRRPPVQIFSAEPDNCDAMARSIAAGHRVAVEPGPTLADGLKPVRVGALNFEIAKRDLHGCLTVNDDALARALHDLFAHAKLAVEPSAAAGLAALRRARDEGRIAEGARVGIMLTGANVDPGLYAELLQRGPAPSTETTQP